MPSEYGMNLRFGTVPGLENALDDLYSLIQRGRIGSGQLDAASLRTLIGRTMTGKQLRALERLRRGERSFDRLLIGHPSAHDHIKPIAQHRVFRSSQFSSSISPLSSSTILFPGSIGDAGYLRPGIDFVSVSAYPVDTGPPDNFVKWDAFPNSQGGITLTGTNTHPTLTATGTWSFVFQTWIYYKQNAEAQAADVSVVTNLTG